MAEVLAAEGWVKAGSVGAYLRETLPDSYIVVADPRIYGHRTAAAVVGRSGLFVIQAADEPDGDGEDASGAILHPNVMREAVARFLRDEFPRLRPPVAVLEAVRDWAAEPVSWQVAEPAARSGEPLAEVVLDEDRAMDELAGTHGLEDDGVREQLGLGLRDRQLTASQTTRKPFVFRSGGAFRTGASVRTVRDAVAHMDRVPQDGIQYLRDGTLAEWLEEEGSLHLAALARDVVRQPKGDMRAALEEFLIGTGLVDRPQLTTKPARVDLGFILQGQKASRLLVFGKGQGRGHLFGEVAGRDSWLRVEPRTFDGAPAEVVVTAETGGLSIGPAPHLSNVVVKSSASSEPAAVPVTLRVVAEPPKLIQFLVRPLTGFLLGAILGAGEGLLWQVAGLIRADVRSGIWMAALALIWGLAGGLRGLRQPPAWPTRYALARWAGKVAAWSVGLGALAAIIVLAWRLGLGGGLDLPGLTLAAAAATGAAFGIAPATLDELAHSRHARNQEYVHGRRSGRRRALLWGGALVLLLVALLAPRVIATTLNRSEIQAAVQTGQGWVEAQIEELGDAMDRLWDQLQMRYYGQPAGGTADPTEPSIKLPKVLGGN